MSKLPRVGQGPQSFKAPLPLWIAIILVILLMCGAVGLFGALIFFLVSEAQQLGLPSVVYVVIFVVVSAVFAWLLKRVADIILGISHLWFSEEVDDR